MKRRMIGLDDKPDKHTVLLLHFDGNVKDETGRHSITTHNTSYSSDAKFGQSISFGSGNSYISIPYSPELLPQPGKEFTVDFWVKTNGVTQMISLFGNPSDGTFNGMQLGLGSDRLNFYYYNGGEKAIILSSMSQGSLNHIALTFKDDSFYFFKNGGLLKTISMNFQNAQNPLIIGKCRDIIAGLNGYIDEYRISNIARWTSNFTPPTKPY